MNTEYVTFLGDIKYLPSQENIGCCTASAVLLASEILYNRNNSPLYFSRLYLYYRARKMQGRIGLPGADLGITLEALSTYGVCLDSMWPLNVSLVDQEPNTELDTVAQNYKLHCYEETCFRDYRKYIDKGIPVVIGLNAGTQFWKVRGPLAEQKYVPINDTTNKYSRGHAVTIVGYNNSLNGGFWIIANSLGGRWGDRGLGALPFSCNNDISNSFAVINFSGNTV